MGGSGGTALRLLYKQDLRPAQLEEEAGLAQGKHARQHRTAAAECSPLHWGAVDFSDLTRTSNKPDLTRTVTLSWMGFLPPSDSDSCQLAGHVVGLGCSTVW